MKLKNDFVGLFKIKDSDELFFKSEYGQTVERNNRVFVQHDAYCISSGEYFWGGAQTSLEREELRVYPVSYEKVKKALALQAPKKPVKDTINRGIDVSGEYDIDFNYICPNCKSVVGDFEIEEHYFDFCPDCGQALDWSDI